MNNRLNYKTYHQGTCTPFFFIRKLAILIRDFEANTQYSDLLVRPLRFRISHELMQIHNGYIDLFEAGLCQRAKKGIKYKSMSKLGKPKKRHGNDQPTTKAGKQTRKGIRKTKSKLEQHLTQINDSMDIGVEQNELKNRKPLEEKSFLSEDGLSQEIVLEDEDSKDSALETNIEVQNSYSAGSDGDLFDEPEEQNDTISNTNMPTNSNQSNQQGNSNIGSGVTFNCVTVNPPNVNNTRTPKHVEKQESQSDEHVHSDNASMMPQDAVINLIQGISATSHYNLPKGDDAYGEALTETKNASSNQNASETNINRSNVNVIKVNPEPTQTYAMGTDGLNVNDDQTIAVKTVDESISQNNKDETQDSRFEEINNVNGKEYDLTIPGNHEDRESTYSPDTEQHSQWTENMASTEHQDELPKSSRNYSEKGKTEELRKLEERLDTREQEIQALKKTIQGKENTEQVLKAELEKLDAQKQKIQEMEQIIHEMKNAEEMLKREKERCESKIQDLEKQIIEDSMENENRLKEQEERLDAKKQNMQEMEKTIQEMKNTEEMLKTEKNRCESNIKDLEKQIIEESMENENHLKEQEERLDVQKQNMQEMEKTIQEMKNTEGMLKTEKERCESKIQDLEKQIIEESMENKNHLKEQEERLDAQKQKMQEMEKIILETKNTEELLKTEKERCESKIQDLEKQIIEESMENKNHLKEQEERFDAQKQKMQEMEKIILETKNAEELLKTEKERCESKIQHLEKQIIEDSMEKENRLKEQEERLDVQKQNMQEMEKTIQEMQNTEGMLKTEKERCESKIQDLEKQIIEDSMENDNHLKEQEERLDAQNQKMQEMEKIILETKNTEELLKTEKQRCESKIQHLEKQIIEDSMENENHLKEQEERLDAQKQKMQEMEKIILETKNTEELLKTEKERCESKIQDLEKQIIEDSMENENRLKEQEERLDAQKQKMQEVEEIILETKNTEEMLKTEKERCESKIQDVEKQMIENSTENENRLKEQEERYEEKIKDLEKQILDGRMENENRLKEQKQRYEAQIKYFENRIIEDNADIGNRLKEHQESGKILQDEDSKDSTLETNIEVQNSYSAGSDGDSPKGPKEENNTNSNANLPTNSNQRNQRGNINIGSGVTFSCVTVNPPNVNNSRTPKYVEKQESQSAEHAHSDNASMMQNIDLNIEQNAVINLVQGLSATNNHNLPKGHDAYGEALTETKNALSNQNASETNINRSNVNVIKVNPEPTQTKDRRTDDLNLNDDQTDAVQIVDESISQNNKDETRDSRFEEINHVKGKESDLTIPDDHQDRESIHSPDTEQHSQCTENMASIEYQDESSKSSRDYSENGMTEELQKLEERLDTQAKEIQILTNNIEEKDHAIKGLKTELESLDTREQEIQALKKTIQDKENTEQVLKAELETLDAEKQEIQELENIIHEMKNTEEKLKTEKERCEAKIQDLEKQIIEDSLKNENRLKEQEESLNIRGQEIHSLKKTIEDKEKTEQVLKTEVEKYEEKVKDLEKQIMEGSMENEHRLKEQEQRYQAQIKDTTDIANRLKEHQKSLDTRKKEIQTLKKAIQEKENTEKTLKAELERSQETMTQLKKEIEKENSIQFREYQKSLGQNVGGSTLMDNNPAITDLSDPNRPIDLGDRFSELYDNEWTEAMEEFYDDSQEEKTIALLLKTVIEAYDLCKETSQNLREKIMESMNTCFELDGVPQEVKKICNYHKKSIAVYAVDSLQKKFVMKQNYVSKPKMIKYMKKCVEVCWFMTVRDPMVVIDDSVPNKLDLDVYKPYTKQGPLTDYLVWPPLYLHKTDGKFGPMLGKGVAQGK